MKCVYPLFYEKFRCTADKCNDSCCKGWDVVLDDKSSGYYASVGGEFGRKLCAVMTVDDDGDTVFTLQDGKCPFLNGRGLCDIYINLGEDKLCETCRRFPRIVQDYGDFEERILSFACPEAARLMLETPDNFRLITSDSAKIPEEACYDADLMDYLLKTREILFEILRDGKSSAYEKILRCLSFCAYVQEHIDNEDFSEIPKPDIKPYADISFDAHRIIGFAKNMDIMTGEWRNLLDNTLAAEINSDDIRAFARYAGQFDGEFTCLAFYYVFRYYINASYSRDVMFTAKSLALAYAVIFLIGCAEHKSGKSIDSQRLEQLMRLYSKEVEHSYENVEMLEEVLKTEVYGGIL